MRRIVCLTAAFCALLSAARFDLSTPGRITRVADPQISPDGKSIAVVVSRANFADNRWDGELVLVDTATKAQTVATRGRRGVSQPRWSPDGSHLSYLATVEGRAQIFALPVKQPGEAMQLTKSPTGVQHYAWRPDGKAIAFVAADEEPKKEGEERHNRVFEVQRNDYLRQDAPKPWHIWIATLDGKNRRVTSGAWTVPIAYPPGAPPSPLTWSADNKSLAVVKVASPYSGEFNQAVIHILNTETGEMRPLTGRQANESQPVFSPDGSKVAYWYARDGQRRNVNEIQIAPVSGGEGTVLTRALDRNIQRAIWMPDGQSLLVSANDITTTAIWHQPLNGAARRLDLGPITVSGSFGLDASVSKSGAIAMTASEPLRPAELYFLSSTNARPERLTDFNSSIAALELGRSETIEWTGADGFKQDGVLTFPPDFQPSRKYPLVLYIHGGPTSASKQTFSARAQLFAAQGWIVFEPNYRGSDNRGNAFQSAIHNDAGAGPGRDVMSGINELKRRGYIDESKMAVSGWSYGGYMTTWMIGNYPGLWKAAVAGAAVTDMMDQYDLGDANVRRGTSFGGSPYTDPRRMQAFAEQSPMTYIPKANTPTLILALTGDYRVPVTQSYRLYHALRDNGVEVKFFAYPLPGHNAGDPVHQRDIDTRWVNWIRSHFAGAASGGAQ